MAFFGFSVGFTVNLNFNMLLKFVFMKIKRLMNFQNSSRTVVLIFFKRLITRPLRKVMPVITPPLPRIISTRLLNLPMLRPRSRDR